MDKPLSSDAGASRLWRPRRVVFTKAALEEPHGQAIAERVEVLGLPTIMLPGNRLTLDLPDDPRRAYAEAKSTLAVVVAPPSKLVFQPIAPSADWRVDLAEGCPAGRPARRGRRAGRSLGRSQGLFDSAFCRRRPARRLVRSTHR